MNDIRTLLKIAARRLELSSFLDCIHMTAVVLAGLALALMIADRAGSAPFVPWVWVAPALAVAGLAAAVLLWARRRRSDHQVALVVDERLDLHEKLSTALYCDGRRDPFALAAVEDAVNVARSPQARETARRRFRVTPPRLWWISPLVVLAVIMTSLLSPLDLFARDPVATTDVQVQTARREAEATVDAVVKEIADNDLLASEMKDLLGELTNEGFDPEGLSADQVKREAIKKVSELNKRLEDLLSGEKGKTLESLERQLSQLKSPGEGISKELADALANADFKAANAALQKLMEEMKAGNLNEEQQKALAEALKNIGDQLNQLAQQQAQLQQALKQAGLDPQLAMNPQALQQALQNNPNLNQQQIQQLQQLAQAQQAACKMCQGLGQACQQMAQGMQGGQMGQGAQGMGNQLNQLEQLQMMLQQAQAAANACQGQAQGLGKGLCMSQGGAFGQRGQGAGGKAPISPTPWRTKMQKAEVKTDERGDIIARMLIDGADFVGESRKIAQQIIAETLEGHEEAISEEHVPPQYKAAHQHYFGELKKQIEAGEDPGGDDEAKGESEPAAEPAESEGEG